jgi:outer membrane receptor protein involved in Fe transport
MDSFGGAIPIDLGQSMGNTTGTTGQTVEAQLALNITGAGQAELTIPASSAKQHQWNVTDTVDITYGAQQWKFGIDFRRIVTEQINDPFFIGAYYYSAQSVLSNSADDAEYDKQLIAVPVFNQLALFAQDEWRLSPRLSLSAGLRWELAPPPHNATSPQPYTVTGNPGIPSTLNLAPAGTPMWHTSWYNFAPRLGLAWQAHQSKDWETVLRVGGGVFFDTSNQAAVPAFGDAFGFSVFNIITDAPLPITQAQQDIAITTAPPYTNLDVYPSHLQLPYTNEWNASIEQGFGSDQSLTISYIGSAGRRLTGSQELKLATLNPLFGTVFYSLGDLTSDYDALQAKF